MSPIPPAILALLDGYRAAVLAKDVDAFAALYAADIEVYDLWADWTHRGRDAWRAVARGWFESLGEERVEVAFDAIRAGSSGDLGWVHAFVRYTALGADGARLRALDNRLGWILRRDGERWTIVHEHTSAPVDPASGKVLLQRAADAPAP